MELKLKRIEDDFWGRKCYINPETKLVYKDVDGVLHTSSKDGEPDCPLRKSLVVKFMEG